MHICLKQQNRMMPLVYEIMMQCWNSWTSGIFEILSHGQKEVYKKTRYLQRSGFAHTKLQKANIIWSSFSLILKTHSYFILSMLSLSSIGFDDVALCCAPSKNQRRGHLPSASCLLATTMRGTRRRWRSAISSCSSNRASSTRTRSAPSTTNTSAEAH